MTPFQAFWARLQRFGSPIPIEPTSDAAPLQPPNEAQDEFPFTRAQVVNHAVQEQRLHQLHRRVIEQNNAYVERGMGRYTELVAHKPNVKQLSQAEMSDLDSLKSGIVFVDPPQPKAPKS